MHDQVPKLLTSRDLADMLAVSLDTVKHWRVQGVGPKYMKLGRCVRYNRADVEVWMKESEVETWTT